MSSRIPVSALDPFFEILRANHLPAGLDRRLRVIEALDAWQGGFPPHRLRTLLCPIFATNADEQHLFYELFDRHFPHWVAGIATPAPVETGTPGTAPAPANRRPSLRRPARALASIVLALIVALGAFAAWRFRSPDLTPLSRPMTEPAPLWSLSKPYMPPVATEKPRVVAPKKDESAISHSYGAPSNSAPPGAAWRWSLALLIPVVPWLFVETWAWLRRVAILGLGTGVPAVRAFRRMVVPVRAAPAGFASTLRKLRHPAAAGGLLRLDVPKTVAATLRAAGLPQFHYEPMSRRPEYLILIDRSSVRDHQATLFEERVTELDRRGLRISAYTFAGDPRVCRNLKTGRSVYLADLVFRTADHRLILFGEGDRLVSDWGDITPAARILSRWHYRSILTPRPLGTWGRHELQLARYFLVLPATIESLAAVVDYFDPDHSARLRHPESDFRHRDVDWDRATPAQIEQALGDRDLYLWLCACALYPQLQWDVTLHLGHKLNPRLLTEANLERLVRLPWFRRGLIPPSIQQALAESLDLPTRLRLRSTILELFEQAPAPLEPSEIGTEGQRLEIAIQQLDIMPEERRAILDDEAVARVVKRGDVPKLALMLTPAARKALFPYGLPALGFRFPARRALATYGCAVLAVIAADWTWSTRQQYYLSQGDALLDIGRYSDARYPYQQAKRVNPFSTRAALGLEIVQLADLRQDSVAFEQTLRQLQKQCLATAT